MGLFDLLKQKMKNFLKYDLFYSNMALNENGSDLDLIALSMKIIEKRNLPYSIKVERVEGNKIFCRNSWGNHVLYIKQDDDYYLETEL